MVFMATMIFVVVMHNGDVDEIDCGFCSGGGDGCGGDGCGGTGCISGGIDWWPCS